MRAMKASLSLALLWLMHATQAVAGEPLPMEKLRLPPGFSIEVLARVPNARQMALGETAAGRVLYVGSMREGKVFGLELDRDYKAGALHVLAQDLQMPVGVAYRAGNLYVSAVSRILRLDDIDQWPITMTPLRRPVVVRHTCPGETHHGWKFIAFGPGRQALCAGRRALQHLRTRSRRYATILRMKADGTSAGGLRRGVRNSVGFDWHPQTGELWFTDNGRDRMGDDAPPDELNRAPAEASTSAIPTATAAASRTPSSGASAPAANSPPPAQDARCRMSHHSACASTRGSMFPRPIPQPDASSPSTARGTVQEDRLPASRWSRWSGARRGL